MTIQLYPDVSLSVCIDMMEKEETLSFDPQHDILCISALNSSEEWLRSVEEEGRDGRPEYVVGRREIDRCEAH